MQATPALFSLACLPLSSSQSECIRVQKVHRLQQQSRLQFPPGFFTCRARRAAAGLAALATNPAPKVKESHGEGGWSAAAFATKPYPLALNASDSFSLHFHS